MFFENKKDNSIPISELSYKIKKLSGNWQDLYQIFKMNGNDFDDYSSIRKIKEVIYNNKNYLIFQINICHRSKKKRKRFSSMNEVLWLITVLLLTAYKKH